MARDGLAGAAATAVVLPQAMAFGVALFAAAGVASASAALAGLLGAAALSLASGVFGGTRGLVSAPTGPALVLLGAAALQLQQRGLDSLGILTGLAAIGLLSGVAQALFGLLGGGTLVKLMPHAVVAGFMTGSAVLMIVSQLPLLVPRLEPGAVETTRVWIPAITAAVTVGAIAAAQSFAPRVPATVAGLVSGTLAFHVCSFAFPGQEQAAWVVGDLPNAATLDIGIDLTRVVQLPLDVVLPSALALAILASLDTLLTALVADVATGERHDSKRELLGQGLGQMLASLAGGMPGAGTTGATVVAVNAGGRRWVGVFVGAVMLTLILVGGRVGSILPVSALAGVILSVAWHMLDRDIAVWLRQGRTRGDALVALTVAGVTVSWDLMIAVGLGVLITVGIFLRRVSKAPVVHRRITGAERHSVVERPAHIRALLEEHGERIVVLELRGSLIFANADQLFEQIATDLDRGGWLVFDMRRVQRVDLTALKLLEQIVRRAADADGCVSFCNLHREVGIGAKMRKSLKRVNASGKAPKVKTFNGSDEALEWCEDELLEALGQGRQTREPVVVLGHSQVCEGWEDAHSSALELVMERRQFPAEHQIFDVGDEGFSLFVVRSGEVEIRLPTTEHHTKRLAKYNAGSAFGEIALLEPGPRAARAVTTEPSELYVLTRAALDQLLLDDPRLAARLLESLARLQGKALRWSAREVRRLAEW